MSNAQRSTLKWEKEEALGEMATVAPVLYTNINFPGLKDEFPGESAGARPLCRLPRGTGGAFCSSRGREPDHRSLSSRATGQSPLG